jgi:hypothetical protein
VTNVAELADQSSTNMAGFFDVAKRNEPGAQSVGLGAM